MQATTFLALFLGFMTVWAITMLNPWAFVFGAATAWCAYRSMKNRRKARDARDW